jgi:hypothetical protein
MNPMASNSELRTLFNVLVVLLGNGLYVGSMVIVESWLFRILT